MRWWSLWIRGCCLATDGEALIGPDLLAALDEDVEWSVSNIEDVPSESSPFTQTASSLDCSLVETVVDSMLSLREEIPHLEARVSRLQGELDRGELKLGLIVRERSAVFAKEWSSYPMKFSNQPHLEAFLWEEISGRSSILDKSRMFPAAVKEACEVNGYAHVGQVLLLLEKRMRAQVLELSRNVRDSQKSIDSKYFEISCFETLLTSDPDCLADVRSQWEALSSEIDELWNHSERALKTFENIYSVIYAVAEEYQVGLHTEDGSELDDGRAIAGGEFMSLFSTFVYSTDGESEEEYYEIEQKIWEHVTACLERSCVGLELIGLELYRDYLAVFSAHSEKLAARETSLYARLEKLNLIIYVMNGEKGEGDSMDDATTDEDLSLPANVVTSSL